MVLKVLITDYLPSIFLIETRKKPLPILCLLNRSNFRTCLVGIANFMAVHGTELPLFLAIYKLFYIYLFYNGFYYSSSN